MARKLDSGEDKEQLLSPDGGSPSEESRSTLTRRSYIELGATTVAALSATATARGTNSLERYGIEFDRTLDAVADLGMDPTGVETVNEQIARAGDGSLVQFPDGTYRFDTTSVSLTGETRGFEGVGTNVSLLDSSGLGSHLFEGNRVTTFYLGNVGVNRQTSVQLSGGQSIIQSVGLVANSESGIRNESTGADVLEIGGPDTSYEFTVDGQIQTEQTAGYTPSGTNVEGIVESGREQYTINGRITDAWIDGEGAIFLNGDRVDPGQFNAGYPNELVLGREETNTEYRFTVTDLSPWATPRDSNSVKAGNTASADRFRFDGTIESLLARGSLELLFGGAA